MTVYREYAPSSFDDNDAHYEDFRDRCDRGGQCPECQTRFGIVAKVDIQGTRWFACDSCKHTWPDPWGETL